MGVTGQIVPGAWDTHAMASSSRRLWIWPLLMVLVWLFIGGPLGSFAGKLAEVQENDNSAYLPQNTESTRALDVLTSFQEQETIPTTVVFTRSGGITEADLGARSTSSSIKRSPGRSCRRTVKRRN